MTNQTRNKSDSDAVTLRQKAEKLLEKRGVETGLHYSKVQTQKLIHELEVHQIELELQNEELDHAKEQAEVASRKYTELYDFAPTGYFTLSKEGEIIELNLSGAKMLGKERSRLKNSMFGFFVSDDTKPIFNLFLRKVFTSKVKESCDVTLSTNKNTPIYVHLTGIVTEKGKLCLLTIVDITKRKQSEEERLKISEERYRSLYENAKIGFYRTTPEGNIILANKALVAMLGYASFDELAKVNVEQDGFETPNQRKVFLEKIEQTGEVENFESTWIRKDRTPVFVRESAQAIRDALGNTIYYDGTAEDISQLKYTQNELDWNIALLEAKTGFSTPNSLADAIVVVDSQGKRIFQNQRTAELLNFPRYIPDENDDEGELHWVANLTKNPEQFIERIVYLNSQPEETGRDVIEYKDGTILDRYTAPVVGKNAKYYGRLWIFRDITERKRAEELHRANEKRLREFNVLQGLLLPPNPIEQKLKLITNTVVRIMGADFARIWMIKPGDRCNTGCIHALVTEGPHVCRFREKCLHLMASSGSYTHINGQVHARVPFGCYKIGKIASAEEAKFLTNNVTTDPRVHNNEWAKELGLVSFAGYRLVDVNGTPLGVLALFSKKAISEEDDSFLEGIAHSTSRVLHSSWVEVALRDSEEKYRALFETSLDGISLLDLNGKIVFANNQVVKLFGYNQRSEFIGLNGFGLIHPEDKPKMNLYFKEFMTTGVITNCEVRSVKKDGSEFIGEYSATLIKNANGDPVYMMDVVRDVTKRKRVEAALRESEARYHLLFEKSADGILIADVETKMFKYANPALCRMLGYDEEELRTLGLADIHPQKDLQHIIAEFESQARGEKILAPDIPCLRKDGSIMYADINTSVITMDGRACAVGLFRDITERLQAEEKLKSSLERSHRQQAAITAVAVLPQLAAGDIQGLAHQVNEYAAKAVDVERISVWLFNNAENELRCVDLYELSPNRHSAGAILLQNEYKNEFEALRTAKYIDANDPLTDPRTTGYIEGYLKPLHITSMLDAVIRDGNRNIGVLCFEHVGKKHNWEPDEIAFASQLADQIALTVLNHERLLAEESLRQSEIKLQVIIESTADGILAIDGNGKVIKTNNRFAELWKIPQEVLNSGDDATLLNFVLEQLVSPKQFLDKVQQLYNSTDEDSDTLFFNDGRIFERYSAPLMLDDKIIGRVWSFRDITLRKRAEEALRESKNIIQNIIDNSPSLIYILDLDGKFILANKKLAEVLNFSAEKLLGNTRQLVMSKVSADQHRNNDLQIINSEQAAIYEEEILESDGLHIYLTQKFPFFDSEGKIYAVGGISTDITERKQTEEAIFKSKEQYRLLVESAPDIIFTIAGDGTFTSLSPAFETLLSWLPEEWIGKPFAGLIHPDDLPLLLDIFQKAMQGELPSVFESRVLTKLGHYLFFEFVIKLIMENGEIKGIMGISRHITERKKAEEKINMLAHAIKNSADCIAITDKDYKIIFVNDSFSKVYGFEKEEIVGQPISVITSKNNLPEVGHSLYSAMAKKEVWSGEVLNKRKDGNDFSVQLSLAPVINDEGELIAIVGVLRDITERKRAEAELKLKNEQLLKLNAEKDKFFSIISHDLRSPFNSFLGMTQIMAEDLPSLTLDQIQEFSVSIRNSATNLYRLLGNLLQWSRMQQGSIPFNPEVIQLLPLAEDCIDMAMQSAKNKGIEITYDIPDNLKVFADNNMLLTVIRNLISNAVKFTHKGGLVNISAKITKDKNVEISVSDTGIGMTTEILGNLFRLDVKANREGTEGEPSSGIGLLLCKEFVEKHGGKIWVESQEGKGATFYFTVQIST